MKIILKISIILFFVGWSAIGFAIPNTNFGISRTEIAPLLTANDVCEGDNIFVDFSGMPGNNTDWIGIYNIGADNTSRLDWWYTNGTKIASTSGGTSGTISFANFSFGNYEVRIFENGNFVDLDTDLVTVNQLPPVAYIGSSTVCEGSTTNLSPISGGSWTSTNSAVALVTSGGLVTGISAGIVSFSFVNTLTGCSSISTPLTVLANPLINLSGASEICIGDITSLNANMNGIWISDDQSIATVGTSGTILGLSEGIVNIKLIEFINGCESNFISITVNENPLTNLSESDLCVGMTTSISPAAGGTWTSSIPLVASITDGGIIKGLSAGVVSFTYTETANGCSSDPSSPLIIHALPQVYIDGPGEICIGDDSQLSPSTGGTWSSLNPSIASISPDGNIIGGSSGIAYFVYTNSATGCNSDSTINITVLPKPSISITGPTAICINETSQMSPSPGGTWTSSNPSIATITNTGLVTGLAPGDVTFRYRKNGDNCPSDESQIITIRPNAIITLTGPSELCIGEITSVTANSTGSWFSSNTAVAVISSVGVISGISGGITIISFVDDNNCSVTFSTFISVIPKPVISINGLDTICVFGVTTLSPSDGGLWFSSNDGIATITSSGVVTGVSSGDVTFYFIESATGCISNNSTPIHVLLPPMINLDGDGVICIGETTTVSSNTSGTWVSDNNLIATVDASGIVTALSSGNVSINLIDANNCSAPVSIPITINNKPIIFIIGSENLCIGDSGLMSPSIGGIWTSSDISIASINNQGVIQAISVGSVTFTFYDNSKECYSNESDVVNIYEPPIVNFIGPDSICINESTQLAPTSGGIWSSDNPSVATINNSGFVLGLSEGIANFSFLNLATGCSSDGNINVTVVKNSVPGVINDSDICIGDQTNINASNAINWISTNPVVASIDANGVITGLTQGTVTFRYTDMITGCMSEESLSMLVHGPPDVSIAGNSDICISGTTTLSSPSAGTWVSQDETIATVDMNGVVTGVATGDVSIVFTDGTSGCESEVSDILISVIEGADIYISGDSEICVGFITTLWPTSGGIWASNNPDVATVSSAGQVKGIAPGIATFSYVDLVTGCASNGTTDPITIANCLNHDFNVGLVEISISGDISTNDNILNTSYQSSVELVSKPIGSMPILNVLNDGSYTFEVNKAGNYRYNINICNPTLLVGCPSTILEITVIDNVYADNNPIANIDIHTTFANMNPSLQGQTININTVKNDTCVNTVNCSLQLNETSLIGSPSHGIASVNMDGIITYTPDAGYVGYDTLYYEVCVDNGNLCNSSIQIITINDITALNSVVASDDFNYATRGNSLVGNVLANDSDPDGDNILILSQGSSASPIITSYGTYFIEANGDYFIDLNDSFSGNVELIYTVCDDSPENNCTQATLHVLVVNDVFLNIRVYIEGALMNNDGQISSLGRPMMRDDLRNSPFTGLNYIPVNDPYTFQSNVSSDVHLVYNHIGPHLLAKNQTIPDSMSVFSVTGEDAIVDWIHIELRAKDNMTNAIATRAGLLQRDGDVVDLDGISPLRFQGINVDSCYVIAKHRTHLGVMSLLVDVDEMIDFTSQTYPTFNFGTTKNNGKDYTGLSQKNNIVSNFSCLWAGDFDSNGRVKYSNPGDDLNELIEEVLYGSPDFLINFNEAIGYNFSDYNMNSKAKYTNPNDDNNLLLGQILGYPLNTSFYSTFNALIEQVVQSQ